MTTTTESTTVFLDFTALLLDTLGYRDDEFVGLLNINPAHDTRRAAVWSPADGIAKAARLPDTDDCWFGVNPVAGPARQFARGVEAEVTRLAALYGDLDVKPGAFASLDIARAVIAELSIIVGTRPSVIVYSGGGLHPYWPITDGDDIATARPVLKRWGRLVAAVADKFEATVDGVWDMSRMLRLPGSFNQKTGIPRPVTAELDKGGPLTLAEVAERLDEFGIPERPEDTADSDTEVSPPADWCWAEKTCRYCAVMIGGFATDSPKKPARNPWLLSQRVRLACAHRLGCITETDYKLADANLVARFAEIVKDPTFGVPREVKKFEHRDTRRCAIRKAAAKTDEQARGELGNHVHHHDDDDDDDGDDDVTHSGHLGMAIKLGKQFRNKLLYVHGVGWHRWDKKRWAPDGDGAARRAVHTVIRRDWIACAKLPADKRDKRAQQISRYENAGAISGILTEASVLEEFSVTVADLDADPWLLNCANGTLDLHTLELRPASPSDRITKVCRGAYHPERSAPAWEAFLLQVLPDEPVHTFVQRLTGAALIGEVREHILPIFTGKGANGKGTFYKAVLHVLGDYGCVAEADLFTHRENAHPTGQMALLGRRFVVVSETDEGKRLAEATMKRLTGGDPITARWMHQNFVTFAPSHLPILVTNHLPKVSGDDPAIWRRIRVVPWDVVIADTDQDKALDGKLQLEADGILSWTVQGLRDYLSGGLAEPDGVIKATATYKADSDSIGRFITEECHPAGKISAGELFDAWDRWRKIDGAEEISKRAFGQALGRLGYTSNDSNGKRWWHGLCILKTEEQ